MKEGVQLFQIYFEHLFAWKAGIRLHIITAADSDPATVHPVRVRPAQLVCWSPDP